MMNLSQPLLEVNLFIPHEHYYFWNPELLGLHIFSDAVIVLAYYSIPLTLFYIVRRRRDLPFTWVLLLFSAFIVACGTAHLMEIWTLWHPTYWLSGAIKLITAVISMMTAIALVQIIPKALALPSPVQLDAANQALQAESTERQQMNLALQASEARLAGILEIAEDAIISIAANQQITLFNQGAERIFGYTAAEAIGQPLDLLLPNPIGNLHRQHVVDFSQTAGVSRKMGDRREIFGRRKDGTEFPAEASISKLQLGDEVIFTAFLRDITERKRIEDERKRIEDERKQAELAVSRLAAIVESSDDAIIGKSLEGMITSWNKGAERLFGYTAAEVIDRPIALLFPPHHADEWAQGLAQITQGESIQSYDTVRMRKDGQPIDIAVTLSPIKNATGQVIGAAKIARDISDRKRAEQALREQETFLRAIGDNIPNGYLYQLRRELDGHYRYTYVSAGLERVSGLKPAAVLADSSLMFQLVVAEDLPYLIQAAEVSAQNLSVFDVQVRERLPNGEIHWLRLCSTPRRLDDGQVVWDGIRLDITDLKQSEAALRQSEAKNHAMLVAIPDLLLRVKRDGTCVDFIPPKASEAGVFLPIQQHLSEILPPDLLQHQLQRMALTLATQELQIWEQQLLKNGKLCYEEIRLIPCATDEVLVIVRDITDRKRAEQVLQEQEAFLREIGDNLPNSFLYQTVRELDGHYRFTYLSAGVERVTGLKPADIVADASLLHNLLLEDDLPYLSQQIDASAQNLSVFDVQVRERLPSGEIRWLRLCSTPRRLDNGQVVWDGIRLDINDLKHTEETLRQSETRNRALIQALPDLLIRMKQDGSYLDVRQSENVKLLNSSLVTANSNIHAIFPADKAQERMAYVQKALQTRELQVYEYQLSVDGEIQFEEARIIPCGEDEVLVIVRDISEAKRNEIIHKQAEVELELQSIVVRNMAEGVCMVKVSDGIFVYTNPKFERMFGYDTDEVIGQHVAIINYEDRSNNNTALYETLARTVLEQGEAIFEIHNVKKDGTLFWCQATASVFEHPNYGAVFVVVQQDITERKQAESQLRDLSNRLVLALKSGEIGTWDWDMTANRLTWDDRMYELYGITPDQFTNVYEAWFDRLYPDDRPLVEATAQQALAGEKDYELEFRVRHPDGTVRYLKAYARVERNQAGMPHRMIGINYDITELKQTASQIEASLKEKEVLLKEIHHRVKNNLGVVDGLLQMQARRSHNPEVIETLKESHNRIASIALVHEKLYSSDDLAQINIAHYIADLTAHLFDSYNIHANQIKLVSHISDIALAIDTAIPCGLIINELVSNALKYAFSNRQAGEIQVILDEQSDQSLCLIVRDNGVGFPQDFDPKQTTTLGMSLIQGLVKQLRGTLAIHGQSGTTVTITFPRGQS